MTLPPAGEYGVGMVFLPKEHASRLACEQELERTVKAEGQVVLGWRDVPIDRTMPMSPTVKATEPVIRQVFIGRGRDIMVTDALERKLYVIRKTASHRIQALKLQHGKEYFVPSMSARTVVYKGLLLAGQVGVYYRDLQDERAVSALAMVHQRFSTNTFPAWELAHPYRMIAHNGEINTVKGNVNWLNARTGAISSFVLGDDLRKLWPLIYPGQSDSASFDNCLELLVMAGYPLAHAMMMMIPEAWEQHSLMDDNRRAFYEYHAAMMEPWDGPAAMAFTDGRQIGATLDRNGLRPARYCITDDDMVIMASEAGVLPIPESKVVKKWRLQPGKMFLIDMEHGRIIDDKELKDALANAKPYKSWIDAVRIKLDALDESAAKPGDAQVDAVPPRDAAALLDSQQAFGYTQEDIKFLMAPMAARGEEAIGSMGNDSPLAVMSSKNKTLFHYFKQLFAQVTNPPIDPIRENLVMSLRVVRRAEAQPARHQQHQSADAARGVAAGARFQRNREDPSNRPVHRGQIPLLRTQYLLSGRVGQGRHRGTPGFAMRRSRRRGEIGLQHPDRVRPQDEPRQCRDRRVAGHLRRAQPPGAAGPAHQHGPGGRDRLGA